MLEFLDFDTIVELICFFTGMFCLSKDNNPAWRNFRIYLFVTCLTELTASYLTHYHHPNAWLYNILIFFEMSFTSLMFANLFNKYIKSRKLITRGFVIFIVIYLCESIGNIYKKGITGVLHFNNITNEVMSVLFVFYALYYFYLLLKDERYTDLRISANFWWVVGVLLFYFGSTAINLYRGIGINQNKAAVVKSAKVVMNKPIKDTIKLNNLKLKEVHIVDNSAPHDKIDFSNIKAKTIVKKPARTKSKKEILTDFILSIFIALLYGCWSYSFICRKWQTTT